MIESIHAHNFKCFSDQRFDIRPLTLLSGLNGSGKSSLIQSMLLLRQSQSMGLLENQLLALAGDYVNLGTAADVYCEYADEDDEALSLQFRWDTGDELALSTPYDEKAEVLEVSLTGTTGADSLLEALANKPPIGGDFRYISADRIGPGSRFDTSAFSVEHKSELGVRGELAADYLARRGLDVIPNPTLAHGDEPNLALINQVGAWLTEISPGVRLEAELFQAVEAVRLSFNFEGAYGRSRNYRSTNVGFGLTYALPIVVAVLSAAPGALLILENPEAHIHPRGQVGMGRLLCRAAHAGVQIVVETHSDHLLNGIRLGVKDKLIASGGVQCLFFSQPVGARSKQPVVVAPQIGPTGELSQWPEGFFDEWERSLDKLLGW